MAGTLEACGVGALDDHVVGVDAGDLDPADALARGDLLGEQIGEPLDPLIDVSALDLAQVGGGWELVLELGE